MKYCLLLCAGAVHTAFSATGVPESDFYPIIEYWTAGDYRANPLCEGDGAPVPSIKARSYGYRQSLGLRELSGGFVQSWASEFKGKSTKDLNYAAASRWTSSNWSDMKDSAMKYVVAAGRVSNRNARPFQEEFCYRVTNLKGPVEPFCYSMGNFTRATTCYSNYRYVDPDAVLTELDPSAAQDEAYCSSSALFLSKFASGRVPDVIDEQTKKLEAFTYYTLWKAIDKVERYAEYKYLSALDQMKTKVDKTAVYPKSDVGIHDLFRDTEVFQTILPSWQVERIFYINEPRFLGGPTLRIPYAVMASDGTDLLIVLRSALTTYETRLAMYNQQSFKYLYNFTGEVHDGSSTIFQTLSGVVEYAVESFFDKAGVTSAASTTSRIIITGAHLPAHGAAIILGSQLDKKTDHLYGGKVKVEVVAFGTPYVGNSDFNHYVATRLNIRSVSIKEDVTDLFPCATTFSCDERLLLPRTGIESGTAYNYAKLPGRIEYSIANFPDKAWSHETGQIQLAAIRDCGYSCAMTNSVCVSDPEYSKCFVENCESYVQF